ncbi:MAG: 2-oxoisovalerate dehydrogenase [Ruminiclostridium sp.]|nr:2-oxoisovalerate dehydrogenase [Ruminiclostridium sp.]
MVNEIIFQIQESPEGGYEAKALGYSVFTEGDDYEDIKKNIKDAVLCHFDEGESPRIIRLHFVKDEVLVI